MKDVHIRTRILKNGNIMYEYRFEVAGIGGKRKWISKGGFKTKGEAKREGKKAQEQYENVGEVIVPSEISFADFLDYWIKHDCAIDLKEVTIKNYENKIRLYIKPKLGAYRLKAIKRDDLQEFLLDMYNMGFAKTTLSVIKGILTKSFTYAIENHYLLVSPAIKLRIPKNHEPEIPTRCEPHVYVPKDKMDEIFKRFPEGTTGYIPLMLGYKCGLRLGEVFGLCWDDIDFEKKTLAVNRQAQWMKDTSRTASDKKKSNGSKNCGNGYWYFTSPKYNSYRIIDLDDELIELLLKTKQQQEKDKLYYEQYYFRYYVDYPLVFNGQKPAQTISKNRIMQTPNANEIHFVCVRQSGEYVSARTIQHVCQVVHKSMNYPEFDFHSLRHTHATMLMENGAPIKYIQTRLGHAKIDVTLNIYQHLTSNLTAQGISILNNMYD